MVVKNNKLCIKVPTKMKKMSREEKTKTIDFKRYVKGDEKTTQLIEYMLQILIDI
jgi:hypothetical protein